MIDSFKVKRLLYAGCPRGYIEGKRRWLSGVFAQNFIGSPRSASFFQTFGPTILTHLKHLRLCDRNVRVEHATAFAQAISSLGLLEELDIIRLNFLVGPNPGMQLELNLPMLCSLRMENVQGIEKLVLDSPRLQKVKLLYSDDSSLRLHFVHGESVQRLATRLESVVVKQLKNLKYLFINESPFIDATLLSDLEQLKEIHLVDSDSVRCLFEQKQRYNRTDLKIFFFGWLLSDSDDPAIKSDFFSQEIFAYLVASEPRLADEMPLYQCLRYQTIEGVAPGLAIDLLNRFTDLHQIELNKPVQDVQRFLDILKSFDNIVELWFWCEQTQELFDRLPEHSAIQALVLFNAGSALNFEFIFRLKHLIRLYLEFSLQVETIRKILEELELLDRFVFKYRNEDVEIEFNGYPKQLYLFIGEEMTKVSDLDAVIQLIVNQPVKSIKWIQDIKNIFDFCF